MSAYEIIYNIIGIDASAPSDNELEAGARPDVTVSATPGMMLPIENPQAPGQPVVMPSGMVRFRLDAEAAQQFGRKLVQEGERLPKRPKLAIASDLGDVDQVAQRLGKLRK